MTINEKYDKAMYICNQMDADEYLDLLCRYSVLKDGLLYEQAQARHKTNLGYYAGYFDSDTRERVERLFKCAHPIFGKIVEKGPPTMEQALQAGIDYANNISKDR